MQATSTSRLVPRARALAACAILALTAAGASAAVYPLVPRDLGSGMSFAGSISTDGTLGILSAAQITGWDITVTQVSDLFYTEANTVNVSSQVQVVGNSLVVPTSPDGFTDGGSLAFRAGTRFGVQVADFSAASVPGGQAYYVSGSAFDLLPLSQPDGIDYVAASRVAGSTTQFALAPLAFPNNVELTGTLTTDGATGPVNLLAWNLRLRSTTQWHFDPLNSRVLTDTGLAADASSLTVASQDPQGNPGSFMIGVQGRFDTTAIILADFTLDPNGAAGLVTPLIFQTVNGLPLDANGNVVVATSVPEPPAWTLMAAGLLAAGLMLRVRLSGAMSG